MGIDLNIENVVRWITQIISIAIIFQTLELLKNRKFWSSDGPWSWTIIRNDVFRNDIVQKDIFHIDIVSNIRAKIIYFIDILFSDFVFLLLLILRLIIASLFLVFNLFGSLGIFNEFGVINSVLISFLFLMSLLIPIRLRGTYNGGSDYMQATVLLGLMFESLFHHASILQKFAVYYIAVQSFLSYFIAGLVKIVHKDWRSGSVLSEIVRLSNYSIPEKYKQILSKKEISFIASWAMLIFELSFPIVFFVPKLGIIYLVFGFVFHLANAIVFGLNLFLLTWIATYPALLFVMQQDL